MRIDWKKPRKWYHISKFDLGAKATFEPVENLNNRDAMEPAGKRICVAPTIAHCLTAICTYSNSYVYQTANPVIATRASRKVWDSAITREGWLLVPTEFVRVGELLIGKLIKEMIEPLDRLNTIGDYFDKTYGEPIQKKPKLPCINLQACSNNNKSLSRETLGLLLKINWEEYIDTSLQ